MIIPALVILVVIGLGVVKSVKVSKKVIWRDGIALLIADIVLIILLAGATSFEWWHGLILMSMYFIYLAYLFGTMKKEKLVAKALSSIPDIHIRTNPNYVKALFSLDLEPLVLWGKPIRTGSAWALLALATLVIGASSALLVMACENLGHALGIKVYFIAVILASAATSMPDTILSIRDAVKGNYDDAVSNALGSNIFDICFALGFPLLVYTLVTGSGMEFDPETVSNVSQLLILLLILTAIAFFIFISAKSLGYLQGILLLGLYVFFTLYIVGVAYNWEWMVPVKIMLENAATGAASISTMQ
jgi:cation:H+ antiporter